MMTRARAREVMLYDAYGDVSRVVLTNTCFDDVIFDDDDNVCVLMRVDAVLINDSV